MPVAKSYQRYTIIGEPFVENGKSYVYIYVNIDTKKKVRWYSDAQYAKMYPEEEAVKKLKPLKYILGFDKGYINVVCGESYDHKDWLKEHGGRYTNHFGWYFVSNIEVENMELPEGLTLKKVLWEDVAINDETLKSDNEIKSFMESILYPEDESQFVGTVGERITVNVIVEKNITLDGYYGIQHMHIMRSDDGNVFVWSTTTKDWAVGSKKNIKGTIKEHKTYRNVRQTVLTRCSEVK